MPPREANPRNSQETAHLARESILDVIAFIGRACQNATNATDLADTNQQLRS